MWSEEWPALFEEEKPVELLERMLPSSEKRDWEFPEEIPVLPLEDNVLFPEIAFPWVVQGETWVRLVHEAVLKDKNHRCHCPSGETGGQTS